MVEVHIRILSINSEINFAPLSFKSSLPFFENLHQFKLVRKCQRYTKESDIVEWQNFLVPIAYGAKAIVFLVKAV